MLVWVVWVDVAVWVMVNVNVCPQIGYGTYPIPYTWYGMEYVLSICYWTYHVLRFVYVVNQLLHS